MKSHDEDDEIELCKFHNWTSPRPRMQPLEYHPALVANMDDKVGGAGGGVGNHSLKLVDMDVM